MKDIAIIYDLDDTLIPTRSIPTSTFQPIFDAIKQANNGTLPVPILEKAFEDLWRKPIDVVAAAYGFSELMITAGQSALINTNYELTLVPFDDIAVVKEMNCKRFLVTTGVTKLQQAKIDSLFKDGDFDEIIIDDPYQENRLGKQNIFADIAQRYAVAQAKVWVVGDNPESEIKAGNALGMTTVQILRSGVKRTPDATHTVNSLHELKTLVNQEYL